MLFFIPLLSRFARVSLARRPSYTCPETSAQGGLILRGENPEAGATRCRHVSMAIMHPQVALLQYAAAFSATATAACAAAVWLEQRPALPVHQQS